MAHYQIIRNQELPTTLPDLWDFISSPRNLKKITPPHMGFDIIGADLPDKMYPGMIISYVVKPLFGIPLTWVTEITHVKDHEYFVDEQRVGPYAIWHHQHIIKPTATGVLMTDIVTYVPPLGFLGAIANSLLIKQQLKSIFDFREKVLKDTYGSISI
jgi:ligand-binding SRPBCC domain-containing protein